MEVGAVSTVAEDGGVGFGWSVVVDGSASDIGCDVDDAGSTGRSVLAGAAPPKGGPPSAYCEQKLSGGPPLACADLVGMASEYQNPDLNQDQPQSQAQVEAFKPGTAQSHHTPLTGESVSVSSAGALTRSAAGRSGVGWDDFCSQYAEGGPPLGGAAPSITPPSLSPATPSAPAPPHSASPPRAEATTPYRHAAPAQVSRARVCDGVSPAPTVSSG